MNFCKFATENLNTHNDAKVVLSSNFFKPLVFYSDFTMTMGKMKGGADVIDLH